MNVTKFVVFLFIGVLCAKVGARKLEEVSKDTELNLSVPQDSAKGVGAELGTTIVTTTTSSDGSGSLYASQAPDGPPMSLSGFGFANTGDNVVVDGARTAASSDSSSRATGGVSGTVNSDGVTGGSAGEGEGTTNSGGISEPN